MLKIFSYGTLQYKQVQHDLFGRELQGVKDSLVGFKLGQIKNSNKIAVELSGEETHLLAINTGNMDDSVSGMVFDISDDELRRADAYEAPDYKRINVKLRSGLTAWLYVAVAKDFKPLESLEMLSLP